MASSNESNAPESPSRPPGRRLKIAVGVLLVVALIAIGVKVWLEPTEQEIVTGPPVAVAAALETHCNEAIGEPRVEQVSEHVWVALAYDLANTILIKTDAGHVIIDPGMSPARSQVTRDALLAEVPGNVHSVIYTHSHIDHVGGASVWMGDAAEGAEVEVWASDEFREHFIKQYGVFRAAESVRGGRQFGWHVPERDLPCSALGRRIDLDAAMQTGMVMPTRTFSGEQELSIGGVEIHLVEAHGETHDQLFVWLPEDRALMPGDNYYRAFPNLYTIRGTSPRPVDAWIDSLDEMRARSPEHLVPSHTAPISGAEEIRGALTRYRDGIQWVRDRVIAGANAGTPMDVIADTIALPTWLAEDPALAPLYGQLDWSARAIFGAHLGWFDGQVEALYPMAPSDEATRTVEMMGGAERVRAAANEARQSDPRWALRLQTLLRDSGADMTPGGPLALEMAETLERLAADIGNSNGRGYLLEVAHEQRNGRAPAATPSPDPAMLDEVPITLFFDIMSSRLIPERAADVHETARFVFEDTQQTFFVTVRRGVAESVERTEPLPGTPEPFATAHTTTGTWRRLATNLMSPPEAIATGALRIEGNALAFQTFSDRFQRGL